MSAAISDVWGFILIGCFLSLILFGIILAQAFTYYQHCEKDGLRLQVFVGILVALDAVSTSLAMAWVYGLFIHGWGNAAALQMDNWLIAADPMLAGGIACIVQLFFAWRLHIIGSTRYPELVTREPPRSSALAEYVIAKQNWLTAFICICSFATLLGGIGTGIGVLWVKEYTHFLRFEPIASVWGVSAAVADFTITVAMTYHLRRAKGGFEATDRLLNRVIQLTLQNGLLTSLTAFLNLWLYLFLTKPYDISFTFLITKLYSNSVLSSLNARTYLRPLANITMNLGERSPVESRVIDFNQSSSSDLQRP
ncbi:hypothetical protein FIBSPDRAFT_1046113 [Athelia psychrophila]|uniref:DUF6534 domain-containing protein n=1 Tax=Athelia psychrophila TaxID=1759441 RepID=A0A166H986_9AGAM|nr:hypothetical protein FIBSPDRAFT_1046113 [Fibularhizoctonia sp. CBS 109695]